MKYDLPNIAFNFLLIGPATSFSLNTSFSSKQSTVRSNASGSLSKASHASQKAHRQPTNLSLLPKFTLLDEKEQESLSVPHLFSSVDGFQSENPTDIPTDENDQSSFLHYFMETFANTATLNPFSHILPKRPIASGQKQIPLIERVAKAIHEESAPWILSLVFPSLASLMFRNVSPLHFSGFVELSFLVFCTAKLFTKFDVPSTNPQPLLKDRDWDYVYNSIWESQDTLESKRKFLTSWFYDTPFERLRREDVISFLAWIHFGIQEEQLTPDQKLEVESKDLPRLEYEVNDGKTLPLRSSEEEKLTCVRFNLEPLRFRHKPLIFYIVTHGTRFYVTKALKELGFSYNPPQDPEKSLGYFFRPGNPPTSKDTSEQTPLVFVHGVGGISYYFNLIKEIGNKSEAPIILLDLPFISLQVSDHIPSIVDQVKSVCNILNENIGEHKKATFVGHSFGSLILSWMVQSHPDRVANCVFLDPICFQLHLRNILFNFHFQRVDESIQKGKRWENPFSAGSFINMAGTEMHTNNAMLRHFWWATNALWPADLEAKSIPTSVMVSEHDEIVPSAEIQQLFSNYKGKQELSTQNSKNRFSLFSKIENKMLLRSNMLHGAHHGEFVFDEALRNKVIKTVLAMMRLNNITEKKKGVMMKSSVNVLAHGHE